MKIFLILFALSFGVFADYSNINTYDDHISKLKHTQINGHSIAYIDEGTGEPIVLMHGIPTNSWMFRKMIPLLLEQGYRVIAPDLLGMGQSEKTKNKEDLLVPNQGKIMIELLAEKLDLASWTHLVHDFGGPVTWEMMKDTRFNAKEFIFLNTPLFKEGFKPGLNIATRGLLSVATIKPLQKAFYSNAIKTMVDNKETANSEMINGYITPLKNGASFTYKCLYFSVNKLIKKFKDYQATVSQVLGNTPIKIIWGENDKFLSSDKQVQGIKELLNLSESNIHILKDTKHIITEEKPSEIVDLILK